MATGTYAIDPCFTLLDNDGHPVSGGLLYTYVAGTTTPLATYTDIGVTTPNSNPIVADSAGRMTVILLRGASYKFIAKTSAGVTLWSRDNLGEQPASGNSVDVVGTAGEAIAGYQAAYLSDGSGGRTAGQWYLADADNPYSSILPLVGFAPVAVPALTVGLFRVGGRLDAFPGVVAGVSYYLSVTAGLISSALPTNRRFVGVGDSAGGLLVSANPPPFNTAGVVFAGTGTVLALPSSSAVLVLTNSSLLRIEGITAGSDGQELELIQGGSAQTDLVNQALGAPVANRIGCGVLGMPVSLSPSGAALGGRCRLRYSTAAGNWLLMSHEQGAAIGYAPTYSATGAMTWTGVTGLVYYILRGNQMTLWFDASGTVGGVLAQVLFISLPVGAAVGTIPNTYGAYNNLTDGKGSLAACVGTQLQLFFDASVAPNWTAGLKRLVGTVVTDIQ